MSSEGPIVEAKISSREALGGEPDPSLSDVIRNVALWRADRENVTAGPFSQDAPFLLVPKLPERVAVNFTATTVLGDGQRIRTMSSKLNQTPLTLA